MDYYTEQKEELFSLESIVNIYEENLTIETKEPPCGHFKANVWLPYPFYVTHKKECNVISANTESNINSTSEKLEVKYLPPINLFFELPETYPSDTCPAFLLACNWLTLSQTSCLCRHLECLWENGIPVLYTWCQFLENEVIEFLNLQCIDINELSTYNSQHLLKSNTKNIEVGDTNDMELFKHKYFLSANKPSITGGSGSIDCRAFNDMIDENAVNLVQLFKSYNDFKSIEIFNRQYHECSICLASKIGKDFITFKACSHFFCKQCLKEYFEVSIRDGNVNCLNCPDMICDSRADGTMVRKIVDADLFKRYDEILLSRTLETMPDVTYCPRKLCQSPVVLDTSEHMGCCPTCFFVFCSLCKKAYHGISPCNSKSNKQTTIWEQYLSGDSEAGKLLERTYGKQAVRAFRDDSLSEVWKDSNSKNCPHCNINIEKISGCNQMTCSKCGKMFCWLCLTLLEVSTYYQHLEYCELF